VGLGPGMWFTDAGDRPLHDREPARPRTVADAQPVTAATNELAVRRPSRLLIGADIEAVRAAERGPCALRPPPVRAGPTDRMSASSTSGAWVSSSPCGASSISAWSRGTGFSSLRSRAGRPPRSTRGARGGHGRDVRTEALPAAVAFASDLDVSSSSWKGSPPSRSTKRRMSGGRCGGTGRATREREPQCRSSRTSLRRSEVAHLSLSGLALRSPRRYPNIAYDDAEQDRSSTSPRHLGVRHVRKGFEQLRGPQSPRSRAPREPS
jgi:hypothetical protein